MPTELVRGLKAHGTSPAKTKSAGRFALLSGRKIFPGQPWAKAGIQGAILRTRPWTPAFGGSDDSGDMRLRRSLIYATWY